MPPNDDEQRRLEEIRRKAEEEEERRLEEEVARRTENLRKLQERKKESAEEETRRQRESEEMKRKEEEARRQREEGERIRKEEEERRRKEEETRKRREAEELSRKEAEARKQREEEEQRRKDEEESRQRREEEERKLKEEVHRKTEGHPPYTEEKPGRRDEASLVEKAIQEGGKRKLAAIMFTDIKGFSKKMGENETAAMELLRIHNATMESIISRHGGIVVKSIGDSFMVDFSSAVNAVKCAIEVQETFWKYNQGRADFEEIQVRIGLHLGDVISVGKDIFGDGVNVASRIESIAEPGRISISRDVYQQVRNKMNLQAVSAGSIALKNIAEPIEVYQVLIETIPELAQPSQRVRESMEQREREEHTRRQQEEAKHAETIRKKTEEELRKREEEQRRRREEEEQRKREHEERRKREEEERQKRRAEEEQRQKEQEEQERRAAALRKAEEHFALNELDAALAEVEALLSADPTQPDVLALDEKIRSAKTALEIQQQEAERASQEQTAAEAEVATEEQIPQEVPKPRGVPKGLVVGISAAVVIAIIGVVLFQLSQSLFRENPSIAVLPFVSQSGLEEERFLGPALAGEVATLLSTSSNARVMGLASSSMLLRATNPRIRAHELDYRYVLTGKIKVENATVSLAVEIIDTAGITVWSSTEERLRGKLAELPAEIFSAVSDAMGLTFPNDPLAGRRISNESAYTTYLRGRQLLHEQAYSSVSRASELFREARTLDPDFAEAHVAEAHALLHMYELGMTADMRLLTQAQEQLTKAHNLRASLAEASLVSGGIAVVQKRYRESIESLERALAEAPNSAEAAGILARVYAMGNNEGKAMQYLRLAHELDPLSVNMLTMHGLIYSRFEKHKDAMAFYDKALPLVRDSLSYLAEYAYNALLSSNQYTRAIALYERRLSTDRYNYVDQYRLARALQLGGRETSVWTAAFERAIATIREELELRPENAIASAYLALAYSRYGRFEEGIANAKAAVRSAPGNPIIKYKLAAAYSVQEKKDEAISALREAVDHRYMLSELLDLDFFNIADEPEFDAILIQDLR